MPDAPTLFEDTIDYERSKLALRFTIARPPGHEEGLFRVRPGHPCASHVNDGRSRHVRQGDTYLGHMSPSSAELAGFFAGPGGFQYNGPRFEFEEEE